MKRSGKVCSCCDGAGEVSIEGRIRNCSQCEGVGIVQVGGLTEQLRDDFLGHDLAMLPEDAGVGSYLKRAHEQGSWDEKEGS